MLPSKDLLHIGFQSELTNLSVNPGLYYLCFVVDNTVVPAALQTENKFVSKLYKRSTTIPEMGAKITQSILALWECIGEVCSQANKS